MNWEGFDWDGLHLGSVILASEIVRVTGVRQSSREYPLQALQVQEAIQDYFRRERDQIVSCHIHHDDLYILQPAQAARYEHRKKEQFLRRYRAAQRRAQAVDISQLTPEEAREHDQSVRKAAMIIQAARRIRASVDG